MRNVKPLWSRFGTIVGVGLGGFDMWLNTLFGCLALRYAEARQAGLRLARSRREAHEDRLSEA